MKLTNPPYDDVFRTLLNDCSGLIIPVINEVFGEHYTGKEEIVFSPNEHFMNQQDGNEEEVVTDTCFKIIGEDTKKYPAVWLDDLKIIQPTYPFAKFVLPHSCIC